MRELTPARPVLCRQSSIPASRHEPEANEFCDLSIDHEGNHSWAPKDLAPSPLKVQREALAADQQHAARTAPSSNDHSRFEAVRAMYERYGADERWTYLDGGRFRLGPDTDPVVTAHAVRDVHGWFMLHILGHIFGPVARGEDGIWREVNK